MPPETPKAPEAKPEEPKAPDAPKVEAKPAAPVSLADWHAAFVKRHPVTLVKPKRVVKMTGYASPEQRKNVLLPKAASVVAHRVLHSLSPAQHVELGELFGKSGEKDEGDALDKWKLRFVTQKLDLKAVGSSFALQKILRIHADPKVLAAHRKVVSDALVKATAA